VNIGAKNAEFDKQSIVGWVFIKIIVYISIIKLVWPCMSVQGHQGSLNSNIR